MTTEAPLVDSHFHVYTTDMPLSATAWHRPPEDATIERLVDTLDRHGVTFGVLAAASLYGDYNDYMLEALRRHRRLRATAIVQPSIGRHALEAIARATPDLLLADLGMPDVNGFELIDQIRHSDRAEVREIPALAVTAYARSEDRARALRSGFQMHVAKPVDPAHLMGTIAAMVGRRRITPE